MKKISLLVGLLILTSCGRSNIDSCDSDYFYNICRLFNKEIGNQHKNDLSSLQSQIDFNASVSETLQAQIDTLIAKDELIENLVTNNYNDISDLNILITSINNSFTSAIDLLVGRVDSLESGNTDELEDIQDELEDLQDQIDELSSGVITEIIDPCGDKSGYYDEILIKVGDEKLIAYFEQRGKRFLSELNPGSYRTTDKQKCYFSVDSDLELYNEHI